MTIFGTTLPLSIFLSQKKKEGKKILSKVVQKMVLQTSFLLINQLQYFMPKYNPAVQNTSTTT
jgi:hypothetical protein